MLFWLTIAICFAFLEFFEVPAIRDWNPFNEATPRYTSPRVGYQHVMGDSNFGIGFDIWQSFMPPLSRDHFNIYE